MARYVKQTWTDGSGGGTPLSAARMGVIEQGVFDGASAVQLFDSTLGGSAASFDITSITNTFSHLLLLLIIRGDAAVSSQNGLIRFNNDSAANYYSERFEAFGTSNASTETFASTSGVLGEHPGASATANFPGQLAITINNYTATTFAKLYEARGVCVRSTTAAGSNGILVQAGGLWNSTAAINRITVLPNAGNFITGSRATLYGFS